MVFLSVRHLAQIYARWRTSYYYYYCYQQQYYYYYHLYLKQAIFNCHIQKHQNGSEALCTLTLWLQLVDKLAHRTCLFAMYGRQIGPHDLTIMPWMTDKSVKLINHARHEWPIKWSQDYQRRKINSNAYQYQFQYMCMQIQIPGFPLSRFYIYTYSIS